MQQRLSNSIVCILRHAKRIARKSHFWRGCLRNMEFRWRVKNHDESKDKSQKRKTNTQIADSQEPLLDHESLIPIFAAYKRKVYQMNGKIHTEKKLLARRETREND